MGVIYCLTSPSGKQYIGQTKRSLEKRIKEHSTRMSSRIMLCNAIAKYGIKSFDIEVLIETNDNMLNHYERLFIDLYNTIEPNGYNIRSGGCQQSTHSTESCKRMSEAKRGSKNHNYGKPRTDETRRKISDARSGKLHHFYGKRLSDDHKQKLSISHKKDTSLPMYMVYVKPRPLQYQDEGYAIINHPHLKTKYFTTKKKSLEEKYNIAFEYLNSYTMDAVQRLNGSGLGE
jgi:group I intron endonuclease